MARIYYVKKSRKAQGNCGKCGDPLPKGSAYRWHQSRYGPKKVRCMKVSCMFRNSELTTSDKLARVYGAGESVEDVLFDFTASIHVKEILSKGREISEAVDEAMSELEDVAMEYEESADNMEEYFSGSMQIDEIRDKAYEIESWRDEFEQNKDTLDAALEELEEFINKVDAYRDEHAIPEDADIIVTTIGGLTDLMFDEEGNLEPFDTSEIEDAISELQDTTGNCPI